MQFIDLGAQYRNIKSDVDRRIQAVLDHGQFILGPEVDELEKKLADWCGAKHCISVANGTDALQITLMALGVGPGDEVISPAFTYVATVEACAVLGAKPVLVDIRPQDYLIDHTAIEAAITSKTKAIIPVSLYGQCADMDAINAIASKHGLAVIEDAAQSFGATHKGKHSGNLSTFACASFFPSKPLGCYGDGGAIFTSDDQLATAARQIARHGQTKRYHHVRVGMNSRLDTIQAAILLAKLDVFAAELDARQVVATQYANLLQGIPGIQVAVPNPGNTSAWAQYTVACTDRAPVQRALSDAGIPTVIHYPLAVNRQPAYLDESVNFAHSDAAASSVLSLPLHPYMAQDDISDVVACLKHAAPR